MIFKWLLIIIHLPLIDLFLWQQWSYRKVNFLFHWKTTLLKCRYLQIHLLSIFLGHIQIVRPLFSMCTSLSKCISGCFMLLQNVVPKFVFKLCFLFDFWNNNNRLMALKKQLVKLILNLIVSFYFIQFNFESFYINQVSNYLSLRCFTFSFNCYWMWLKYIHSYKSRFTCYRYIFMYKTSSLSLFYLHNFLLI